MNNMIDSHNNKITDLMASFIDHTSKVLPDDVLAGLVSLRDAEQDPVARRLYDAIFENLRLASELDSPICQDTGILHFWIRCGSMFPFIGEIETSLVSAVVRSTENAPLRPNVVSTFEERNTGTNTGDGAPIIWFDIVPGADDCEIYTYMSGGGCSLPGRSMVLPPSSGYEGLVDMVMDTLTVYGPNACPPLLVGIGIGPTADTAAMNSKKALMRPIDSNNKNEKAAAMEKLLKDGINALGMAPHGIGGSNSVLGVNIVSSARHPATFGVAVNVGCWCHRRGRIIIDKNLGYNSISHSGFKY